MFRPHPVHFSSEPSPSFHIFILSLGPFLLETMRMRLKHLLLPKNLITKPSSRTWRFKCNEAYVALLQMLRSLSNRLEAGLNTRLTKTLRGESLIPWWICAVRSTTVTWKLRSILFPHYSRATVSIYIYIYIFICVPCTYVIYNGCIVCLYIYYHRPDSRRQHSTCIRTLSHAHTYVVAWWQAVENAHRWQQYLLYTYKCISTYMFLSQWERASYTHVDATCIFLFCLH